MNAIKHLHTIQVYGIEASYSNTKIIFDNRNEEFSKIQRTYPEILDIFWDYFYSEHIPVLIIYVKTSTNIKEIEEYIKQNIIKGE